MTESVEPMTVEEETDIRGRDNLPSMQKVLATIDALRALVERQREVIALGVVVRDELRGMAPTVRPAPSILVFDAARATLGDRP